MEIGNYVIIEDIYVRKIRKGEFPIGRVAKGGFKNEYTSGDRVPIEFLCNFDGILIWTIEVDGILYPKGTRIP